MSWLPHLLALLVVGPALADRWVFAPIGRDAPARFGVYARIVAWQWAASGLILLEVGPRTVWLAPPDAAALVWRPPAWTAAVAALAFVVMVARPVLRPAPLRPVGARHERTALTLVALTSGIGEEIMFRGFLLGYLHVSPWHASWPVAIGTSCLAFGLGHLYQGLGFALRATAAGLLFCGLYLASGSLLLPVAAHSAGDLVGLIPAWHRMRRPDRGGLV